MPDENTRIAEIHGKSMAKFIWTDQLNVGIEVIDQQHRRIVEYINQLDDARSNGYTKEEIGYLLNDLVDYTISHFGFEESMQEEANYPFAKSHKKVHELFTLRIAEYQAKFENGEDVSKALNSLLVTWLFNHIKRDDADYVAAVKANLQRQNEFIEKKKGLFARLFG
ncbi:MAG TPA: bacteriohemerythrin [Sideroxyarcus sp.]|nr:bacteriohemerythrin [Sideroxyarcus sp.]